MLIDEAVCNLRLWNGDCIELMKNIEDKSVDCIICDLPYNQVISNDFDNQWGSTDDYLVWVNTCLVQSKRILKDNGSIILFCSRQNQWKICQLLSSIGFIEQRTIIWARRRGFNTTRGKALASGYEPILYWSKSDSITFNSIKIPSHSQRDEYVNGILKDGVTLSDVWSDIPALPHNSKEKVKHPTQKPLALMERIVKLFTNKNDEILDFCMGSGSTGVACVKMDRKFIGIEVNSEYYELAKSRIYEVVEDGNDD